MKLAHAAGALLAAGLFASGAQAQTLTYTIAPDTVDWVQSNGQGGYAYDGGEVYGTFTYDWTTDQLTNVNLTSTGATNGSYSTINVTSGDADYRGTYGGPTISYGGVTYAAGTAFEEWTADVNGSSIFIDFTQLSTTDLFPGTIGGVHTSEEAGSYARVLSETVTASGGAPTGNPPSGGPSPAPEPA